MRVFNSILILGEDRSILISGDDGHTSEKNNKNGRDFLLNIRLKRSRVSKESNLEDLTGTPMIQNSIPLIYFYKCTSLNH